MASGRALQLLVFTGVLALAGAAFGVDEATLYYVDDHDGANACGGSDFSWATDTVGYLSSKLNTWNWDEVYYHGNTWVDSEDLSDVDEDAQGHDHVGPYGIDSADLGMAYSHGGYNCSGSDDWGSIKMGDSRGDQCSTFYGNKIGGNDVWWGDSDLNIMIIDTCNSARWCLWNDDGLYMVSGNLAALLGFHGISYDSSSHTNNFEDFVDDSRYNGLGDNWVDDLTRRPIGSNNDECAVAVIYADTLSAADYIFDYGGLEDWKAPGSHNRSYYYYIDGCNPKGGTEL